MATTLDDAVAMVRACREAGVKLGVGYHLRQHLASAPRSGLIAQGVLHAAPGAGPVGLGVVGRTDRCAPVYGCGRPRTHRRASTMMGTGVHVIDLLRFVLGQEVTEVAALTDGQTAQRPLEQLVTMILRFDRGTLATMLWPPSA